MSTKSIEIIVSGTVQGVYFRKFVKETADKLNIKGWVKNLKDGSVQINAFGSNDEIELFITKCREGNLWSDVKNVIVNPIVIDEPFKDFEIIRRSSSRER